MNIKKIKITIEFRHICSCYDDQKLIKGYVDQLLNDLDKTKSLPFQLYENAQFYYDGFKKTGWANEECEHIRAKLSFKTTLDLNNISYFNTEYVNEYEPILLSSFVEQFCWMMILSANIAYMGLFDALIIRAYVNGKLHKLNFDEMNSSLAIALFETKVNKWPQLDVLPIHDVWEWLPKKEDRMSDKPIERAINSVTYLWGTNNYEDFVFSMLGLESIYNADGNELVRKRFKDRVTALLGEPTDNKLLNQIYNFRSEFLHGSIDFYPKENKWDILYGKKDLSAKYDKYIPYTQAILIATIQKFVKNKSYEINFPTTYKFKKAD